MKILYSRLFNLSIKHGYYKNGIAKGLCLNPTNGTLKLLKGGKMLFKNVSKGVTVLYRTLDDEVSPFVDLGKDVRMLFELSIENQNEFQNITALDESLSKKYSSSNILYFKNDPSNASIDPDTPEQLGFELIDFIQGSLFTYEFSLDASPEQVLFRIYDEYNTLVSVGKDVNGVPFNTTLTLDKNDNNTYGQQIDLKDKPKGKYVIIARNFDDTDTFLQKVVYIDDELLGKDICGIVDIIYNTAEDHIYKDTEEYAIQFSSMETIWKYLIVNKNNAIDLNTDNISINDAGTAVGPYSTNTFVISGSVPNADVRINDLDTVVFKSNASIPYYEIPKMSLQLKKNSLTEPVLKDLPNPSHSGLVKEESGTLESEIYVFI